MDSVDRITDQTEPAAPEASESTNDRVFRFISDPRYKENLSGRVRAACITCRRKKIKCSGEINCQTCQERGLVCEGLPERKRPKRNSVDLRILEPLPAGIEQARRQSVSKKNSPKQRPTSLLRLVNGTESQDSGCDSLSPPTSGPAPDALKDTALTGVEDARKGSQLPSLPFQVDIFKRGGGSPAEAQSNTVHLSRPASSTRDPTCSISSVEPCTRKRSPTQNDISWWNNPQRIESETESLTPATRVIFGESPQPANRSQFPKPKIDLDGMPLDAAPARQSLHTNPDIARNRRQSIQLPVLSRQGGDSLQFNVLTNQPGIFDDMALLLAARTQAPDTSSEFASWWGMDADLGSMLPQVEGVGKDSGVQVVEETSSAPLPTTIAAPASEPPKKRPVAGNFYW